MNRRDFLKATPKMMCASGAAMYVAGKMLDQQKPVLDAEAKLELVVWRHENEHGHVWHDLRETLIGIDGEIYQKPWGEKGPVWRTVETYHFRRDTTIQANLWPDWGAVQFTKRSDWA